MDELDAFERAVLDKLLAGAHPALINLRAQAQAAQLTSRRYTGVGFLLSFEVPPTAPFLAAPRDFHLGDVNAVIDGLRYGAGFVVFVRDGRIDVLEGYSYEEPWPSEVRSFKLTYQREPRDLSFLEPA